MSNIPFAIHLGGNLYLDSNGDLRQGPAPKTPIYEPPYKLPVDPHQVRDALMEVKKALKGVDQNNDVIKVFKDLDFLVPVHILKILDFVGRIAGYLAPVASVLSIAVDIAKVFGFLKDGPSALENFVRERFEDLEKGEHSIGMMIASNNLVSARVAAENFSSFVSTHVKQLENSNPSPLQLDMDMINLKNSHEIHINAISRLFYPQTWMSLFDRNEHSQVWSAISDVLYTMPGGPGSPPVPVTMPAQNSLYFDHRLMVPLVSMVAESYLASIRGILPEYRTTGDFRDNLKNFADNLSDLAQLMRENAMARTVYEPHHFANALLNPEDVTFDFFEGVKVSPNCKRWPVGALDLRYHNNAFFGHFNLWGRSFIAGSGGVPRPFGGSSQDPSRFGLINAQWTPPAVLEPVIGYTTLYRIANPEECAKAANAQSESDYAKLLAVSGYFELLQLAALFRHEFTAPDKSQTVFCKKPNLFRNPLPSSSVTVESIPIFKTGVIQSSATREPQEFFATVSIKTQTIKRARPVQYRIKLRTLKSINGGSWLEPEYANYQSASYEPDSARPGFMKLVLEQSDLALDDFPLLAEWMSSPRDQNVRLQGVAELTAHTFDWWIPVVSKPPFIPKHKIQMIEDRLLPPQFLHDEFVTPGLLWKPGGQDWIGEHRDLKQETIKIDYTLDWKADRLTVSIKNTPEYRNFVIFVVVEELMPGTGQVLHTAAPIPIHGLLTFVPQKFFDDEAKAFANALRAIVEFYKRYYTNRIPGPADPIIGWIRPDEGVLHYDNVNRFMQLAEQHEPELLREVMSALEEKL